MRLICPNCDAEYEVGDDAIPEAGRDVQCSGCGHAWFQLPPDVEAAIAAEEALFGAMPATATEQDDDDDDDLVAALGDTPAAPPNMPPRRTMDESILAVLREEAEREAAVRRTEAAPLETQTELGLVVPAPAAAGAETGVLAATAARRIARMKGIDPDAAPPPKPASRRELLPDIETLNSTLRPGTQDTALPDIAPLGKSASERSGFRNGFLLMMILAAVVVATYVMAPRIAEQIPGAAPALKGYVASIDALRLWLDGVLRAATQAVRGMTGEG